VTDTNDYHDSAKFYLENTASVCIETAKTIGQATDDMVTKVLADGTRTALRKAQAILRLATEYSNNRLEDACLRAILFDNYTYKSLKKILMDGLDARGTKTFSTKRAANNEAFVYIREATEYASAMEVHYE
ncbi:MAG: hypothetical protein ACRC1W_16015, partial [Shewanella sp.]